MREFFRMLAERTAQMPFGREIEGDGLVASDQELLDLYNGVKNPTESEYRALLNSPKTLRRARILWLHQKYKNAYQALGQETVRHTTQAPAANDAQFWADSRIERRAADAGDNDRRRCEHHASSGLWRVRFEPVGRAKWVVQLALLLTDSAPQELVNGAQSIELVDGCGEVWLKGTLGVLGDGELGLQASWKGEGHPEALFKKAGGSFLVRAC